ncbi:3-deoxy-manno-octulosonate cytidylyltransferase [Cesiribacter andamanensis]|uniref:3-deoxy-manno-octulosonate cytidylyltransferase n=1 Tax=Cesiribacter andamanensis AMV16 TaxID=1279009 RepID=M7N636_9BACT|nr:3-deoxy-manno-octulosonate cytidylyltransferase [Cesiribacter andamanensis]EMR02701.1 3-deoxy-manno-octulosonate cytidylyltransferase [Cesiribacter andamanensis AMV16]
MKILGIIPSRWGSTRFPGKALADIAGTPMVVRVWQQASQCPELSKVVIATDHEPIADAARAAGAAICMTSPHHPSGTDRCADALQQLGEAYDYVINIQGDEPFIDPRQISALAQVLDGETQLATLVKRIAHEDELFSPNVVKVVLNARSEGMYFSREPIPHLRNVPRSEWLEQRLWLKHIGIYAYRCDILQEITKLPQGWLENIESLEQLRWLEAGYTIRTAETQLESMGIDTPEDLERALATLKNTAPSSTP